MFAALDHIHQGLMIIEPQGRVSLANAALEALLGLTPDLLQQQLIADLLNHPTLQLAERLGFAREELEQLLYQLEMGDWSVQQHEQIFRSTEAHQRQIHRAHILLYDEHQQTIGLLLRFTDVTDLQELRHAQTQFVSMIVHDLRSPLTALTSSIRLLREIAETDPQMNGVIFKTSEIASRAVKKLLNMVNSLLDMFKLESGNGTLEREAVDIFDLLKSVMAELKPLADEMDVSLETHILAPNIPLLDLDSEKMERVLYNLIDNAIKFSPSEGVITLRIHAPQAEGLRIDVIDTGTGIPAHYHTKLFDPYQQIDEQMARRRGTGLGLTFCKLAIEAHGGQIWIEDNPEGGAIFAFILPLAGF